MRVFDPDNKTNNRRTSLKENGIKNSTARFKERLKNSPVAYRLARGAFWSLVGGAISRIFAVLSSIIIARLLGREGYGEMGMVQSTIGMLAVLGGFGLGTTATKYIAQFRCTDIEKVGKIVNLSITLSAIGGGLMMMACVILSPVLTKGTLNRPDLAPLLSAASLLLFVSILNEVQFAVLAGFEAFRKIARINILQGISAPFLTVPCVMLYGIPGAIAALTISAALGLIMCCVALASECNKHHILCRYDASVWGEWQILWKFALPAMISALMVAPATWIANTILVNQQGGYGELGLFNAANQWRIIVMFIPGLLTAAMLPVLSETHGRTDLSDFRQTVALNLRVTWVIALPLTVVAVLLGKPMAALFGKQFSGASAIIMVLMIATFFNVVNGTVGSALAGSGRMWTGTVMNMGWAASLLMSAFLLVPSHGGLGLALAYLFAYVVHTIWVMVYVETKLAPSSIVSQWKLMLLSALLLGVLAVNALESRYVLTTLLILASSLPAFGMLKTAWSYSGTENASKSEL